MKIHQDIYSTLDRPTAVALGFFDGVHRGHQAVINAAVNCRKEGLAPIVFTFTIGEDAPAKKKGCGLLQTTEERERWMASLGVEELIIPDFKVFAGLCPRDFAEKVLCGLLYAKVVVCGEDFRFGKGASAGIEELRAFLEPKGVELKTVPAVWHLGAPISSTRIRGALQKGETELAREMLGHPFTITGEVMHGKKLGRKLGFPTVNLSTPAGMVPMPFGVYATSVEIDGVWYRGVSNLGIRPTVTEGVQTPNLESYILDYTGDLYGRELTFQMHSFLRPERRFDSVEELKAAISADAERVRAMQIG